LCIRFPVLFRARRQHQYHWDDFIGYDQFEFYYYINNNVLYKIKGATSVEYKILYLEK
jgi:hypothetical protein